MSQGRRKPGVLRTMSNDWATVNSPRQKSRIRPGPGAAEPRRLHDMAMGKRPVARQASPLWVETADLPTSDGHPFFERLNRGPGGLRVRRVRGRVVLGLLRGADGTAESASWAVFPDAVDRLLRGPVFGAGDCVAGGRFTEPAVVPGPGVDRVGAGSLDVVADAPVDRRGDARGGLHVGSGAPV